MEEPACYVSEISVKGNYLGNPPKWYNSECAIAKCGTTPYTGISGGKHYGDLKAGECISFTQIGGQPAIAEALQNAKDNAQQLLDSTSAHHEDIKATTQLKQTSRKVDGK